MSTVKTAYRSPFGDPSTDHDTPDALCLDRGNFDTPMSATIEEYGRAALRAIDQGDSQPAFFLARQLAELSIKGLIGPNHQRGHDLAKLLKVLEDRGDDLFTGTGEDLALIREFILDMHRVDPGGDEGRYPTSHGVPALGAVCCANPEILREHVTRLFAYVGPRVTW